MTGLALRRILPALLVSSTLLVACATAQAVGPAPGPAEGNAPDFALVRAHMDEAKPGLLDRVAGTRAEFRAWVRQHAMPPGETPVSFLRVGDSRLWALRPAARWEDIPAQARRDAEVERKVSAAVAPAAREDNAARMHGNILEHHNELLRYDAELSRGKGTWTELLAQVRRVVMDQVIPDRGERYDGQAKERAASGTGVHLVFFSSPGSGATIHLLGDGADLSELPDRTLVRDRRVETARMDPALGSE